MVEGNIRTLDYGWLDWIETFVCAYIELRQMVQMLFKEFRFLALVVILFRQPEPLEQFWKREIWRIPMCNYFEFWTIYSSADFFYFKLLGAEWLGQIFRGPYGEHLCKIILNLGRQFRSRCCSKIFQNSSSGSHFVWHSRTHLGNFARGSY